jgi:5-methylcytosine-specific restriction endonuclease McrA
VPPASVHTDGFVREAIPQRVRHEVWRRDQGRCVDCRSRERLAFDHIIPVSKGGSNTVRNIELRCETCNRRKSASVLRAFRAFRDRQSLRPMERRDWTSTNSVKREIRLTCA